MVVGLRPTKTFKMGSERGLRKGLGQLEAYLDMEEGVAFQMDNGMYWGSDEDVCIKGVHEKVALCKFHISRLPSGKVCIRNWKGLCLAPMDLSSEIDYPIQPVLFSNKPYVEYDVFWKDNHVAFKAYNGLFLVRTCRVYHTLAAAKFHPDVTCYFQPLVGDHPPPAIEIMSVVPCDVSSVTCSPYILEEQVYVNHEKVPVTHTFVMFWEPHSTDHIIWTRMWGLGMHTSCTFTILDTKCLILYTEDNEQMITFTRFISEYLVKDVVVPPRTEARAHFCVDMQSDAILSFIALVRKKRSVQDVTFFAVGGSWMGLIYSNFRVEVRFTDL
ncbi:uncharacterized protein LOC103277698 isoform X2 [Anolis carolinensis]|uniref:uncharacterized protein LOC103277698 isoform X2 n=1 Tax=Anolis carolinensis TaxID=28377 RepID=UPI000462E199|nr:PREDICTED: uncharacterized protein LOC103277698 isoform X2 [Anolis carolinensis]|eukprot:XP_008101745.1 PREDICTED: uncharacterized protein LOC103277698 isoform X2 [Anolis carolinensis]